MFTSIGKQKDISLCTTRPSLSYPHLFKHLATAALWNLQASVASGQFGSWFLMFPQAWIHLYSPSLSVIFTSDLLLWLLLRKCWNLQYFRYFGQNSDPLLLVLRVDFKLRRCVTRDRTEAFKTPVKLNKTPKSPNLQSNMVQFTILAGGYDVFIAAYLFNAATLTLTLQGKFSSGYNPSWITADASRGVL